MMNQKNTHRVLMETEMEMELMDMAMVAIGRNKQLRLCAKTVCALLYIYLSLG